MSWASLIRNIHTDIFVPLSVGVCYIYFTVSPYRSMFAIVLKICTGGKCRLFPRHDGCFLCVCVLQESWSALLCASKEGHLEIVIELLEHQAQLEHTDMVSLCASLIL